MDLADGHTAAVNKILSPDFSGVSAYNLGTGHGISVLEMVAAFERATGVKIPVEIAPRRPGDVAVSYATAKLAETELGWKTKYTLDDMCKYKPQLFYKEILAGKFFDSNGTFEKTPFNLV